MPKVIDILNRKGCDVVTITTEMPVIEAVHFMSEHKIGAVVVLDKKKEVVGIFSERDLLNRVVEAKRSPNETNVGEVMSTPVAYISPETTIDECRLAMTQKRIRHFPVLDKGKLVGVISIGDVVALELAEHQTTIKYLKEYLYS